MEEKKVSVIAFKDEYGRKIASAKSVAEQLSKNEEKVHNTEPTDNLIYLDRKEVRLREVRLPFMEEIDEEEYENEEKYLETLLKKIRVCIKDGTEIVGKKIKRGKNK